MKEVELVILVKTEQAALAYLYLAFVRQNNEGQAVTRFYPHTLKYGEMEWIYLCPYVLPRLERDLAPGDHLANREASLLCLGKPPWKSASEKQEGEAEEIDKGSIHNSLSHDGPLFCYTVECLYNSVT
jgi:hypothetical protein